MKDEPKTLSDTEAAHRALQNLGAVTEADLRRCDERWRAARGSLSEFRRQQPSARRVGHVTRVSRDRFERRPDGPAFSQFNEPHMKWVGGDKPFELTDDWHIVVLYRFRDNWYRTELIFHAGMCHDGSSVPLTIGGILRINYRDVFLAGLAHDGLYQSAIFGRAESGRAESDRVWRTIAVNGTKRRAWRWQGWVGEKGLWAGGRWAWNNYRRREKR
jgi:hypothetical protein